MYQALDVKQGLQSSAGSDEYAVEVACGSPRQSTVNFDKPGLDPIPKDSENDRSRVPSKALTRRRQKL